MGLIVFLVVLVLLFGGSGFYFGPPYHYYGGGMSLLVVIIILFLKRQALAEAAGADQRVTTRFFEATRNKSSWRRFKTQCGRPGLSLGGVRKLQTAPVPPHLGRRFRLETIAAIRGQHASFW